jgi:hypothetical protein
MATETDETTADDARSRDAKSFDATMDVLVHIATRLEQLLDSQGNGNNSHNQSFTVSSGGWVSILCACVAVVCLGVTVIELARQDSALTRATNSAQEQATRERIATEGELHDLRAWSDIYRQRIQNLEQKK